MSVAQTDVQHTQTATAAETLQRIVDEHELLTAFGFGVHTTTARGDVAAKLAEGRRELRQDVATFKKACDWINRRLRPIKSINRRRTSYWLKHACEREIGYLTNGCFIAAMIANGYEFRSVGPNAQFNVSETSCKQVADMLRR